MAEYGVYRKFRIVRDAALLKYGDRTLRHITLIGKHHIVVDAIKDLTPGQAKALGRSFSAKVSGPPEIIPGTKLISNLDAFDIAIYSYLGENFKFTCRSENDGRLYADCSPFGGGFTMERLRKGKWRTNTGTKDLMLLHTGFAKD